MKKSNKRKKSLSMSMPLKTKAHRTDLSAGDPVLAINLLMMFLTN
jgi:hypothetical protein